MKKKLRTAIVILMVLSILLIVFFSLFHVISIDSNIPVLQGRIEVDYPLALIGILVTLVFGGLFLFLLGNPKEWLLRFGNSLRKLIQHLKLWIVALGKGLTRRKARTVVAVAMIASITLSLYLFLHELSSARFPGNKKVKLYNEVMIAQRPGILALPVGKLVAIDGTVLLVGGLFLYLLKESNEKE